MGILLNFLEDFSYYNHPEGQDPLGKVIGFGKIGFTAGCYASAMDCILYTKCQTFTQVLNTSAFWIVPLTGMCVSFASVTYIMNRVRGKDDHVNYFVGTLSSGYVLHKWCNNARFSVVTTMLMCLAAAFKKDTEHYGRQKFLDVQHDNKWVVPWRNREDRKFLWSPKFNHNKEDYWRHM